MLFKEKYRIPSARLPHQDYSAVGQYFVTLDTKGHECFFGRVQDNQVMLSMAGEIVADEWQRTATVRANVTLDEWQIMPNHLHGIIVISRDASCRDASLRRLKDETFHRNVSTTLQANSLGAIIGQFKGASTKRIRAAGVRDFAWQPRFYDHVIRNSDSLEKIRAYIRHNPLMWDLEKDDPENIRL